MNRIISMNHSARYQSELESLPELPRENDVYRLYVEAVAAFGKQAASDITKNISPWNYDAQCVAFISALCDADRRV
jgi:hypothetical protein